MQKTHCENKSVNELKKAHTGIINLSRQLRDSICHACRWSQDTYYRKMRAADPLSPVEKEKIPEIAQQILLDYLKKC